MTSAIETLPDEALITIAGWLPPDYRQRLACLSPTTLKRLKAIGDTNVYWCLQYCRLGYQVPTIVEPLEDLKGLYAFLKRQQSGSLTVLPGRASHLRLTMTYFQDYLSAEMLLDKCRQALINGDVQLLKLLKAKVTTDDLVQVLKDHPFNPGHYSIIESWQLSFSVAQLKELQNDAVVVFVINHGWVNDLAQHDELLGDYIHDAVIVRALLYQGLNPRYQNDVLVTKIESLEIYRLLRDDGRLALDGHKQVLLRNLRHDIDIVVELLSYGLTPTPELLKFLIANQLDQLHRILPYLGKDLSAIDTIQRVIATHPIIFHQQTYYVFEDLAEAISQDDAIASQLSTAEVQTLRAAANSISYLRRFSRCHPTVTLVLFSLLWQVLNLVTTYVLINNLLIQLLIDVAVILCLVMPLCWGGILALMFIIRPRQRIIWLGLDVVGRINGAPEVCLCNFVVAELMVAMAMVRVLYQIRP
jgi:hypothetical protein